MNIPQSIIDKIDKGIATYNTVALGGSGAYSIPVPENKYIIIFGFTFNHFTQKSEPHAEEVTKFESIIHHLQFQSKTQRFLYNFRTLLHTDTITEVGTTYLPLNGAETLSCYQIHQSDVNISIWNMLPPSYWAFIYNFPPTTAQTMEANNIGYFKSKMLQTLKPDNVGAPNWIINPLNVKNDPLSGSRVNFVAPIIDNLTNLPTPAVGNPDDLYQFPLLNVYYSIVNIPTETTHRN